MRVRNRLIDKVDLAVEKVTATRGLMVTGTDQPVMVRFHRLHKATKTAISTANKDEDRI